MHRGLVFVKEGEYSITIEYVAFLEGTHIRRVPVFDFQVEPGLSPLVPLLDMLCLSAGVCPFSVFGIPA